LILSLYAAELELKAEQGDPNLAAADDVDDAPAQSDLSDSEYEYEYENDSSDAESEEGLLTDLPFEFHQFSYPCVADINIQSEEAMNEVVTNLVFDFLATRTKRHGTEATVTDAFVSIRTRLGPYLPASLLPLLPKSYAQALKTVEPLLSLHKAYNVCRNECVVYSGALEDPTITSCPKCGLDRLDPETQKPWMTYHHIPLIPRLKRFFEDKVSFFLSSRLHSCGDFFLLVYFAGTGKAPSLSSPSQTLHGHHE
jgi:hypothetical protein